MYAPTVRFPRDGHPNHPDHTARPPHRGRVRYGRGVCWSQLDSVTAVIARGKRPVPFRTRKLSPSAPMVLHGRLCGRVGRRRTPIPRRTAHPGGPSCVFGCARNVRRRRTAVTTRRSGNDRACHGENGMALDARTRDWPSLAVLDVTTRNGIASPACLGRLRHRAPRDPDGVALPASPARAFGPRRVATGQRSSQRSLPARFGVLVRPRRSGGARPRSLPGHLRRRARDAR